MTKELNSLKGTILNLKNHGNLTLVEVQLKSSVFKSIIIDNSDSENLLVKGKSIDVLFKETEVIIGKDIEHPISLRNRLKCEIRKIEKGELLSKLTLDCDDGEVRSIITSNAVDQLELKIGELVWAMIKTNEVMLSN